MKNWIKEETPALHNLLNEYAHDFGTQNAHGFPKTGRHLAPNFENQNWPCQARGSDEFWNETAKLKGLESAQALLINPLLYTWAEQLVYHVDMFWIFLNVSNIETNSNLCTKK